MIDTEAEAFHENLKTVFGWFQAAVGLELFLTSTWRNDKGVHNTTPMRAADARCRDEHIGKAIAESVNRKFIYDPKRPQLPVCIYHLGHLHFQVHDNTSFRA